MTARSPVRVIVVDDEEPARWRLRELLEQQELVEVVAVCDSGRDAIDAATRLEPDVMLLDIQMPEVDGFDVLDALPPDRLPLVVFVTAFDAYAVQAFETHSLDYVMKPFTDERLLRALDRARSMLAARERAAWVRRVELLLQDAVIGAPIVGSDPALRQLVVRTGSRGIVLDVADIRWIEAAGVYVQVHAGSATYLHRVALTELTARLAPAGFVRVHRSALVNRRMLREIVTRDGGDLAVVLDDGTRLPVSRRCRVTLEAVLGQSF